MEGAQKLSPRDNDVPIPTSILGAKRPAVQCPGIDPHHAFTFNAQCCYGFSYTQMGCGLQGNDTCVGIITGQSRPQTHVRCRAPV